MTSAVGGYAFGDSGPAARRLDLLAALFEPTTHAFLTRFAGRPRDLGGGLGWGGRRKQPPAPPFRRRSGPVPSRGRRFRCHSGIAL